MKDYQEILEENKKLKYQVGKLEKNVEYLKGVIEKKKESNRKMVDANAKKGLEIKRLKVHIAILEEKINKSKEDGAID